MSPHEPGRSFKWPVSAERLIAVPAPELWKLISRPGNLELCHPFCASNPVQAWPGQGSRDEVHYLSGWIFERHIREWIDGVGYDLDIGRHGGRKSTVSWRVMPIDDHSCMLRITVYPFALQKIPAIIRWIPHVLWLRRHLGKYLDSVVKGFEWCAIRGEPVPRNAFGTHPWFSARGSTTD